MQAPTNPLPTRDVRKQNLLLASQLARGQFVAAFDPLAQRADWVAQGVVRARAWLASPSAWVAASAVGALALAVTLRRGPARRLLRWGWMALGVWRSAAPVVARYRARR